MVPNYKSVIFINAINVFIETFTVGLSPVPD